LLSSHAGQLVTVLFYESSQKSLALSANYQVKPSGELIRAVEELLGEGTIVIK
jgi:DNA polymerase-3 subunit alpha